MENNKTIVVTYADRSLEFPAGTSVEEARDAFSQAFPAVQEATAKIGEDGNISFEQSSGSKG